METSPHGLPQDNSVDWLTLELHNLNTKFVYYRHQFQVKNWTSFT